MDPLRFGVLGAARITPQALIKPAQANPAYATVTAVAARDRQRAQSFATKHAIASVLDSYAALVADPGIDAVYNPLPNGLHGRWTLAAIAAGKHVLCEKPFTADAAEAQVVAAAAEEAGVIVAEAFHYRYHPLVDRLVEIIDSGEIGDIERVETAMCFPLPKFKDIRYQPELAGGALMDAGCYAVHLLRTLGRSEPTVVSAKAKLAKTGVDRAMSAEFNFPGGGTGAIVTSMWSKHLIAVRAKVIGTKGSIRTMNPYGPQYYNRTIITSGGIRRRERFSKEPTYSFQLRAFVDAVRSNHAPITSPVDAIANMTVIDAIYRAAGMAPRAPTL